MCTSIVVNKKKTIVGWNLDLLGMEYRVRPSDSGVYIEINDKKASLNGLWQVSKSREYAFNK